ncbi:MAG: molybdopterin-dependent oxidoreductase, partial [Pseudomonadota bacterium]
MPPTDSALPVNTTCPYCGVGCGVTATPGKAYGVSVSGDNNHPANRGNLCLKGQTLGETLSLDNRLLYPEIFGERSTWDAASTLIADKFKQIIDQHGRDAVAFYVSGQLLTEDYYAVNKFVKGYLGTANIDTNSRLCMASSVAGHKRAFGADTVPGCYDDLEQADLVILAGSNLAWCHPVLFNRLQAAREANHKLRVITIDPRRTATADLSDDHLPILPDSDTALFAGLLRWLSMHGYGSADYIDAATTGLEEALNAAGPLDLKTVAQHTGLSENDIAAFYAEFADTPRVVTVYSQGINQSVGGTDKVNAIINCHLYTGRIGKPGSGPFSITGQPNAMGGRETGGLANTLTCHMELGTPSHRELVQSFWQSPNIAERPGLTAVELFNAVYEGRIKALWIMATNP